MNRNMLPYLLTILLVLAPVELLAASQARGQTRNNPPSPPQLAAPLTISQVIESLYSLGVTRTEDLISKNKVQFEATPEIVGILKELGATDKLLALIPKPKPQPVAPTPVVDVPKVAGPVRVVCEPSDCTIVVNQTFYGSTEDRSKILPGLKPGSATIQVFSNGYVPQTQQLLLQEGRAEEARFQLVSTPDSQQAKGQRLVLDAMNALGGVQAMTLLRDFQGDGTLDWKDEKGAVQQGSIKFTKNFDKELQLEVKTKDGSCSSLISGESSKQTCRGSLKNSEKTMETATANLLLYEVQNVLGTFIGGKPTLVGNDSARRIKVDLAEGSYVLTLDEDKLPVELEHTRRGAVPSVIKVRYSDYGNISTGKYPVHLTISADGNAVYSFAVNGVSTRSVMLKK